MKYIVLSYGCEVLHGLESEFKEDFTTPKSMITI